MKLLIFGHSSLGTHRVSIGFLTRFHKRDNEVRSTWFAKSGKPLSANSSTSRTLVTPGRALPMARRLIANVQHAGSGCNQAPLPGKRRPTSTNASISPELLMNLTSRISFSRSPTFLHPIHVRTASLVSVTSLGVVTALITNSAVPSSVVDVRAVLGPVLLILTRPQPQT